jgi:hypothetical protein
MVPHKMFGVSLMTGTRKMGRINHYIRLLQQNGIKYDPKEIEILSLNQLTKKIIAIEGPFKKKKWRSGDNLTL